MSYWKPGLRARLRFSWRALAGAALLLVSASPALAAAVAGADADLAARPLAEAQAELKRLAENGAASVRLYLDWNRVEPQPTRFTWKADDAVVNAALAAKLDVVLVLGPCASWAVNPAWRVPAAERPRSIPRSPDLWERYVRESVKHFRGRVRYWQVREHPNVRNFRGARSEYLRLLMSASRIVRAVDPGSKVVIPEGGAMDVADIEASSSSEAGASYDIVGIYLPTGGDRLSASALSWAVLTQEGSGEDARVRRPVWVLGSDGVLDTDAWLQHYLLASAFGVERCYMPPQTISRFWVAPLADLAYVGWLRLGPDVWALVFQEADGPMVAAWSPHETELALADLAPVADAEAARLASALGGPPGSAVAGDGDGLRLRLGPRPALIRGLDVECSTHRGAPTRADVLAARPGLNLNLVPFVYADYGLPERPEFGLYNRPLRSRLGGGVTEATRGGRSCLRTHLRPGASDGDPGGPWVFLDVDDSWLYLARGKTRVAVTVECRGAYRGEEEVGFNIMYDSVTGYRFTPWQWVAEGTDWRRYRVELEDVSFAGRNGYDFRINAQGSNQDIWIASVIVEKLPDVSPQEPPPSGP